MFELLLVLAVALWSAAFGYVCHKEVVEKLQADLSESEAARIFWRNYAAEKDAELDAVKRNNSALRTFLQQSINGYSSLFRKFVLSAEKNVRYRDAVCRFYRANKKLRSENADLKEQLPKRGENGRFVKTP